MDDFDVNINNINEIPVIMCPYCKNKISNYYFQEHLEECVSTMITFSCEVCQTEILDKSNSSENYISHLLTDHSSQEIQIKVKNNYVLNLLGLVEVPENNNLDQPDGNYFSNHQNEFIGQNNIPNFNNNIINSYIPISENIFNSSNNIQQQVNLPKKTLFEYNIIQCKLCLNLICNNSSHYLKNHLENFHNININSKNKHSDNNIIQNNYGSLLKFKSEFFFHLCQECFIYMENDSQIIDYHNKVIHFNSNTQNLNSIQILKYNFKCHQCNVNFQTYASNSTNKKHLHASFISSNELENQLWKQTQKYLNNYNFDIKFLGKKIDNSIPLTFPKINKPQNSISNTQNNSILINSISNIQNNSILLNTNSYIQNILPFKNINSKNKNNNPTTEDMIKEWELYSSITRPLPEKINEEFKNNFSDKIFDYIDFMSKSSQIHHYYNQPKGSTAILLKRLNTEFSKFGENLPCNFSSSYFIRADSNYPQFLKVLITGVRGTPYEHGLFEFDIYLPNDYPNGVPLCNLTTTGNGIIRFNPNLYNCGKVCLSLLGTWGGNANEKWDSKHSNLTQLLISLSSLVMNDRIIENEPSYSNACNSINGLEENEGYANIVRIGNIKYAMLDKIKNPGFIFESLIKEYFSFKNKELIEDVKIWISRAENTKCEYTGLVALHNTHFCNTQMKDGYVKIIKNNIDELEKLII